MVSDEGERRQLVGDGLRRGGRRAREELRGQQVVAVDEEPGQRAREQQVRAQQAAAVDERSPRRADAAGDGEALRREPAEDACQHVVGE